jgi:hypothetical protein
MGLPDLFRDGAYASKHAHRSRSAVLFDAIRVMWLAIGHTHFCARDRLWQSIPRPRHALAR